MVIIAEGIRKSGKTTFADALTSWGRKQAVPVFCFFDRELQSYPVNQLEANFVSCMQFAKAAFEVDYKLQQLRREPLVLLDRFHISELIFGCYHRGYDNSVFMNEVDQYLAKRSARLVLFNSSTSEKRAKLWEMLYRKDFQSLYQASSIKHKTMVSLDDSNGALNDKRLEKILATLGF